MSGQTPASHARAGRGLAAIGLITLIGVASTRLDRSELTASEGTHAQAALGPIENDLRGVPDRTPWSGPYAFWRGWAFVTGTTERSLRLPVMLGLLLAAAVAAEAAVRLAHPSARGTVFLLFASSPFVHRNDLLHPALFAALPAALLLGGAVYARGGSWWWLAGAALGGAGVVAVDPRMTPIAAAGVLAAAAASRGGARALFLLAVAGGSVTVTGLVTGLPEPVPEETTLSTLQAGGGFLRGWPWLLLIMIPWAVAVMRTASRRAALSGAAALACGSAASMILLLPSAPPESWTVHGVVLIFAASAFEAAPRPRPGFLLPLGATVLALAASFGPFREIAGYGPASDGSQGPDPIRMSLAEAREAASPGGRLVVAGPDRTGVIYYVRRGHDPGVPIILIPEDVSEDGLAALLRHQFRAEAGQEARLPPILYRPPPNSSGVPPGLHVIESPAPPLRRILRLGLRPLPPR